MSKFDDLHLGEELSFQAGGILTAFSSTREEVELRKKEVTEILEKEAGDLVNIDEEGFYIDNPYLFDEELSRIISLMEEKSILEDALYYLSMKIVKNWSNINDIKDTIIALKFRSNRDNFVENYEFVENVICEIIDDLLDGIQNGFIIPNDDQLISLAELINVKDWFLNSYESSDEEIIC